MSDQIIINEHSSNRRGLDAFIKCKEVLMTLTRTKSLFSFYLLILLILSSSTLFSQVNQITIERSDAGKKLVVNGKDFIVNGMNWDYFPIGTNYNYSLWNQPDDFIKTALDAEMGLLKTWE
jgi:hypothetical protein